MAVDGDLAVGGLVQGVRVLAGEADRTAALLGEAGVVEDQHGVALGGQLEHPPDALAVEVVLVPGHGGHQPLEPLLGGAGDDLGTRPVRAAGCWERVGFGYSSSPFYEPRVS